jgi:hypothetical protein
MKRRKWHCPSRMKIADCCDDCKSARRKQQRMYRLRKQVKHLTDWIPGWLRRWASRKQVRRTK